MINHDIRIPTKQPAFHGKYPAGFFDRGSLDPSRPRCAESGRLWCELCGQPGGVLSGKPRMNPWLNISLLHGLC